MQDLTPEAARELIIDESRNGVAYSSRSGDYGTPERLESLIQAIITIQKSLAGQTLVNRELFAALFTLGDQLHGNFHGALARGLNVPDWLAEDFLPRLSEALQAVFEDYEVESLPD